MPTNEERRKAAKRIMDWCPQSFAHPTEIVRAALGLKEGELMDTNTRMNLAERIADLIEPEPERTCKNLNKGETDGVIFVCSESDAYIDVGESWAAGIFTNYHDFSRNSSSQIDQSFCPNCCAKVIDNDN